MSRRGTRDWYDRWQLWQTDLERTPRGRRLTDAEGTVWWPVTTDLDEYRVWMPDHGGGPILERDLAGMLAAQDVAARRHVGSHLAAAARHAADGTRWTVLGLWRTPVVRLAAFVLATAVVVAVLLSGALSGAVALVGP